MNPLDFLINSAKKIVNTGKSGLFDFKPLESFKTEPVKKSPVMDFSRGEGLTGELKEKALAPLFPAPQMELRQGQVQQKTVVDKVWNTIRNQVLSPFGDWEKEKALNQRIQSEIAYDRVNNPNFKEPSPLTKLSLQTEAMSFPEKLVTSSLLVGLGVAPIATSLNVLKFAAVNTSIRTVASAITGKKIQSYSDVLPENYPQYAKDTVDILGLIGTGFAVRGLNKKAPMVIEKMTKDLITKMKMPERYYIEATKVKDIFQTGQKISPQESEMIRSLGLSADKYQQAIKNGITIEVPAHKIVTISDKPYWAKMKSLFHLKATDPKVNIIGGTPTEGVRGFLPAGTPQQPSISPAIASVVNGKSIPTEAPKFKLGESFSQKGSEIVNSGTQAPTLKIEKSKNNYSYTPESKKNILEVYKQGESSTALSEKTGIGETTILRWIKESGIIRTSSETKGITVDVVGKIKTLYAEGKSTRDVATDLGLNDSTVHAILQREGLTRSPADSRISPEVRAKAIELYRDGLISRQQIAKELGMSESTVKILADKAGVGRTASQAQATRAAMGNNKNYGIKIKVVDSSGNKLYTDSSYELARIKQLQEMDDIVSIENAKDVIPYKDGTRNYNPDLLIKTKDGRTIVEEIKPAYQLANPSVLEKANAATKFYADKGIEYKIVSESDIGTKGFDDSIIKDLNLSEVDKTRIKNSFRSARSAIAISTKASKQQAPKLKRLSPVEAIVFNETKQALKSKLDKLFGMDVPVQSVISAESMSNPKALGEAINGVIKLLEQNGSLSEVVANHEGWHWYKRMLDKPTRQRLTQMEDDFASLPENKARLDKLRKDGYDEWELAEELMADEFAGYTKTGTTAFSKFKAFFDRLWATLKNLFSKKAEVIKEFRNVKTTLEKNFRPSQVQLRPAYKQLSEVDRLIAEGKIRVKSVNNTDIYQYKKGNIWQNARDESSAVAQVTKPKVSQAVELPQEVIEAKIALEMKREVIENSPFNNKDNRFLVDREGRARELGDTTGKLSNKIEDMMREAGKEDAREYTEGLESHFEDKKNLKIQEQAVKEMEKKAIEIIQTNKARAITQQKVLDKQILDNLKQEKEIRRAEKIKFMEETIAEQKRLEEVRQKQIRNINQAKTTPIIDLTNWQKMVSQPLNPLKFVDTKTREIFETWNKRNIASRIRASAEAELLAEIPMKEGMDTILKYQKGEPTPYSAKIKEIFDRRFEEAKKQGLDIGYTENYLPQTYKERPAEIKEKIGEYLKDRGMSQEQITAYQNGEMLSDEVVKVLKVTPFFNQHRVFPSYEVAMQYGLTPQYTHPAMLLSHWVEEIDRVVTNKKLVAKLLEEGKILPFDEAPMSWDMLNLPFSREGYMAPPTTAKLINGLFGKEEAIIWHYTAGVSKTMQQIVLSAGIPYTDVNFFAIGQLIKELTSGNVKSVNAFLRANSNQLSANWIKSNRDMVFKMAKQGIDLRGTIDSWHELHNTLANAEGLMGKGKHIFDNTFEKKTFKSFMPMMQIQVFKDVYNQSLKKGLSVLQAEEMAGRVVKNNFGLTGFLGRSGKSQDVLSTFLFAPTFREGIINTLYKTGQAGTDFVTSVGGFRTPTNPAMSRNRRLIVGMIITYALYNLLNMSLNDGDPMWKNPKNRKFALRVPLDNGDVIYVEFMPSFLAFGRNLLSGGINLVTGDFKGASQKFGSVFSMPIKLVTEVVSNRDFWGNPIYQDTDSTAIKMFKLARYAGVSINHPFIAESIKLFYEDKPAYQAVLTAMEMPLKFSSVERENLSKLYDERDRISQMKADENKILDKQYKKMQSLLKDGKKEEALEYIKSLTPDARERLMKYKDQQSKNLKRQDTMILESQMLVIYNKMKEMAKKGDTESMKETLKGLTPEEREMLSKVKEKQAELAKEPSTSQVVLNYAKAVVTDPSNALKAIFTKEKLGKVEGNLVELQRFYGIDFRDVGGSQEYKRNLMEKMGLSWNDRENYKLEHITPVSAGGDNSDKNLYIASKADHDMYTPIDIAVGNAVKLGKITRREATKIMTDLKINKTLEPEDVYLKLK